MMHKKTMPLLVLLAGLVCAHTSLAAPVDQQTVGRAVPAERDDSTPVFSAKMGERDRRDVEVELRYYAPRVRGAVEGPDYYTWRTHEHKLEFRDDLGIDATRAPEIRVRAGAVEAGYMRAASTSSEFKLNHLISRDGDRTKYLGNLDTKMNVDYLTVAWRHDFPERNSRTVWLRAGLRYLRMHAEVHGYDSVHRTPKSESDSASGIVPIVGAGVRWEISPKFGFTADASGMYAGSYGHTLDVESAFLYHPADGWTVAAGGRWINMFLHKSGKDATYQAEGPFLSVRYAF